MLWSKSVWCFSPQAPIPGLTRHWKLHESDTLMIHSGDSSATQTRGNVQVYTLSYTPCILFLPPCVHYYSNLLHYCCDWNNDASLWSMNVQIWSKLSIITRHRSLGERGGKKALLETLHTHTHTKKRKNVRNKPKFTNLKEQIRAHRTSSKAAGLFLTK